MCLPPTSMHRWIGEWFYYNFAAGSFHTKKLFSRLYSIELEFYSQKRQIRFLSHHLRELGVTYASIARWKARGRLPIHYNWTFFASSYGWDVISRYWSKSAFFKGGGSLYAQISGERGQRPPTSFGRKLDWLPFHVVSKFQQYVLSFRHKAHVWQTDRQTDRENYDP